MAYTYKASDKVFILKIPTNALEYKEGDTVPILYPTNEMNQYQNKCFCVLPEYVLGYVETSKEGISSLQYNTAEKKEVDFSELEFTDAVVAQYRRQNQQMLTNIRTDRFYTDSEKKQILHILYTRYKRSISKKLAKHIKSLMPETELEKSILATPKDLEYCNIANAICKAQKGKKVKTKYIEEEFSKPRKVMSKEIGKTIPYIIIRENEIGRALLEEEIIEMIAETNGFDKNKIGTVNQPKTSMVGAIKARIKSIFNRTPKLLEEPKTNTESRNTAHEEFVAGHRVNVGNRQPTQNIGRELKERENNYEGGRE